MRAYYRLTKPGIIYGNLLTCLAGFLVASQNEIDWGLLLATLLGTASVIACGCVINNYLDRGIDSKMNRTKRRAFVTQSITAGSAIVFGISLGLIGFGLLALYVNWLTILAGATGLFFYLVLYSFFKRRSPYGTLVGSVSGSTPPVAGYVAVTASLDKTACLLFLCLVSWQMAHFYAIAIYRLRDYRAAGIPVWPIIKGVSATKRQIIFYIVSFIALCVALAALSPVGWLFLVATVTAGVWWLRLALKTWSSQADEVWAKQLFMASLLVILIFSVSLSLDALWG